MSKTEHFKEDKFMLERGTKARPLNCRIRMAIFIH